MDKNILLVFPKTGIDLKGVNVQMPIGLMYVAAPLVEKRYEVTILDQRVEKDFFRKVRQSLESKPICVGVTTMTGSQILYALETAKFIRKNSQTPIVFGGVHPTLMPEQTLENDNIDIVVRGEGEITFEELINALDSKKPLREIKGISYKDGQIIHHNEEREFLDLDTLPPIPYELIDVKEYILPQIPGRRRSLDVYTSRGCPWSCIFCYNRSFNKSKYRTKNIDAVIREIEFLSKRYNLDSFYINDDTFFIDAQRSHYFCNRIIDKKIDLEWGCQGVRIDSLEKIDFDLLMKSGCRYLYIGIESGSKKILKYIQKQITIEQIKNIINRFSNSKIIAHYNFMVGYPIEGEEELFETMRLVDYIMKVDPKAHFSSFHLITPYPGTEFYDIVKRSNFKPPSSIVEWGNVRWESECASWIPSGMRKLDLNLTLLTYFIDSKVINKGKDKALLKMVTKILMVFAKFHWKYRKFRFCPEFRMLNKLVNYKIERELKRMVC